ncbi:MAG: acyltransferase [Hyphomonadaceae bacterium]|nr:acyltransferase [Hyphomonadaceae bacterium]
MIANIQVLRAVAALAVVLHHTQFWLSSIYYTPLFALVGRSGVDLFFLISGFIMVHTTRDGMRSAPQFWTDRAIRVVPLYWLGTTLVLLLVLAGMTPLGVPGANTVDVVTSYLFIPDLDANGEARPILDVGWTLNYEMYFYLLFGLTLFIRPQARALLLLTAAFAAVWLFVKLTPGLPFVVSHYGSALTFEFLIGGAIALWYQRPAGETAVKRPLLGAALVAAGLVAVLLAGWKFAVIVNDNPELRVAAFGGPAILVLVGALLLERAGVRAKSGLLLLLGAASYSIYLVHPIVLPSVMSLFADTFPGSTRVHKLAAMVVSFGLASSAGVAVYLWIERPMTAWLRAVLKRRARSALAA